MGKCLPKDGSVQLSTKVGRVIRPEAELSRDDPNVEWFSRCARLVQISFASVCQFGVRRLGQV